MTFAQVQDLSFMLASDASYPDVGQNNGGTWLWPGAACTANTYTIYPYFFKGWDLYYARWVCAWNPQAPSNSPGAVRLVYCDDGPTNIQEITEFTHTYTITPIDDTVDITAIIKPLWASWRDNNQAKHIGHQTAGYNPLIYQSRIELYITPTPV